jgi:thiosulfate/3-mercaptopyruvate sulfurtransferase
MKLTRPQFWLIGTFAAVLVLTILSYDVLVQNGNVSAENIEKNKVAPERSPAFLMMLTPISVASSSDVLLDISENSTKHIKGSVVIPYTSFIRGAGLLKSVPEISKILGDAGISSIDKLVVYGECMPCGGGPAPATYIYWMLKLLGHENVTVLDGNVEDWAAAGLSTTNKSAVRPIANYTWKFTPEFIASYEYVKSGKAQIVDARPFQEFNASSIPGAINIPYDNVLDNHSIRSEAALKDVFAGLNRNRPVVVFTDTGIKASVVWFALELMGYEAKIYSWQDWLNNQIPAGNVSA